ncbi:nuclear transport factor 2 domain-containing protein [Colletotrichum musicola]|uniref:Nuclear transport factor 2 domain-containing protein n=1 Tax=Colletotrichum musicola TaxID=2175873 RepID=A0A8H6KWI7_9PEZI|nr:nuclear transport factor 2 domain-containing protein [Colletotrichum musicola]
MYQFAPAKKAIRRQNRWAPTDITTNLEASKDEKPAGRKDFEPVCPEHLQEGDKSGAKCSVLVQVTGRVYYGKV